MSELSGSKSPALHDVAPYPGPNGVPINARTMGAHYAAFALMHHTLACDLLDTEDREGIKRSTNMSILGYGIAHLLNSLAEIGARGDQAAWELWEDQRHPSSLGPDLRSLLAVADVNPEAVVKVAEEVAQRHSEQSAAPAEPKPTVYHDSVDHLRRELITSHLAYQKQVKRYFGATLDSTHVPKQDAISDARDASMAAANVGYGLAAVLGYAQREFGADVAHALASVAGNVMMNGDDGDVPHNADIMPLPDVADVHPTRVPLPLGEKA